MVFAGKMNLFEGVHIAVDLSTSITFKQKVNIRKLITDNGGVVSYMVTKKVCTPKVITS